jgi:ferredoxin
MEKNPGETGLRHIVFCKCGGERIDAALLRDVDEYLGSVPVIVTRLSDLCGLAAKRKDELTGLLSKGSGIMGIGCHRRSMEILFRQVSGENNPLPEFSHLDLINASFKEIAGKIDEFCNDSNEKHQFAEFAEGSGWPAWYPVIDYTRCTSCGQCADFCLFGVYHKQEGLVNSHYILNVARIICPACARICPATAIIFPKIQARGSNWGFDEIDEQAEHQRQARDIEQFLVTTYIRPCR